MPRIYNRYAVAQKRAHYLRLMYARRGTVGYRGQAFYKRQWPYVYRGMFKSKGLRRKYRYGGKARRMRMRKLYPKYY